MKIATKEKAPGRVHYAAGANYTFNPEPGTEGPNVCDVQDPAAVAVFLHERNSNLFYALDPVATLTRSPTPAVGNAKAEAEERARRLAEVLAQNAAKAIEAIDAVGTVDDLKALDAMERAKNGGRKTVLDAIEKRAAALAGPSEAEEQARLILGNDEASVLAILDKIEDPAIIAAAKAIEAAAANRATVLAKLGQKGA